MKKISLYLILFLILQTSLKAQIKTVGTIGGDFTTLKAAFDAINSGTLTGNITLHVIDNTSEAATAVLFKSGTGLSSYTSITLYPTIAALTISGNIDGPLIDLNGADNVTLDGRVNQSGAENLTITNISAGNSASTVRFIGSASNNTIKYCKILGSEGSATSGIIFFSTDGTSGGGNSTNTITNNDITSYVASGRPVNAIYSSGTVAPDANSGNIISNNNIFDFLNTGANSAGVYLSSNSTGWTISGNSFYETTSFSPSADGPFTIIQIDNTLGNNFTVSGNFIGGNAPSGSGSQWIKNSTFNNAFTGLYLNVGTVTASSVQNNSIKNFSWFNSGSANWTGIDVAGGDVNIGTTAGNNIGASAGFIYVAGGATNTNVYGINIDGAGTVNSQYNNIGYIITFSSTYCFGINRVATASGTIMISSNTISNITASSPSNANPQSIYGINNAGAGSVTIAGNIISSLVNNTSNSDPAQAGVTDGIISSAGATTISSNSIHNLSISNANTSSTELSSVCGIVLTGNADLKTATGNTIYALSNNFASFAGSIIGLFFSGSTGANTVSGNFIYYLFPTGGASTNASVYGIKITGGDCTYSNNIINLGGSTSTTIYGIYESGSTTTNLYFNTVYISGNLGSGVTNSSYALYNGAGSAQRDFRNNIFVNARSTIGGSALHFAAYISTGGSITCDYNDYFFSGTGGMSGFYGGNIPTGHIIVTDQDVNSLSIDPTFTSPGLIDPQGYLGYKISSASLPGVFGTGINIDFGLNPRGSIVTMGAWESAINLNTWTGTTSTDWGTISNWSAGILPAVDASIIFSASPGNDCFLDADHSVTDITNGSTKKLITNGHKLTIKGYFNLATSSQIDASTVSSAIEFAGTGTAAQTIPSGVFFNNQVYNLVVNNAQPVQLQGTISLLNSLTVTLGQLNASTYTYYQPTMIYSGSSAQSLEANQYLNDEIYNLTIDNTTGVSVNTNFKVDNILTINSGKLLNINPGKLLTVPVSIINNAGIPGLVIKSDATGDGKLINSTSTISGTVELYLPGNKTAAGSARFHYFVPPVISMNVNNTSVAAAAADLGLTHFNGDLASYSEVAAGLNKDAGWQYFDGYGSTTAFPSLESSMGYNIYLTDNDKITFKGTLNSAGQAFSPLSFTNLGWNLVGNPYPCNYDLNGIPELTSPGGNVYHTIYFNHDGGFGYWNLFVGGTTGYSDIIPPMQGFFVRVTASEQSLTIPASSKTSATAAPLRSKGTSSVKKLKLVLNNGLVPDETIVCLIDKATTGFDGDFDGYKLFGKSTTAEPYIYTELNGIKYAINSVPIPDTSSMVIPLSVILKSDGIYKIDITEFENLDGFNVVLKHGAVETTLIKDASYTFTLAAGTYTDFQIIISKITTAVEKISTDNLKTWYSNNFLYINCPDNISSDNSILEIYDLQGKKVYNDNKVSLVPGQTIQFYLSLPRGMYITHVKANNQIHVSKFIIY